MEHNTDKPAEIFTTAETQTTQAMIDKFNETREQVQTNFLNFRIENLSGGGMI